MTEAPNGYKLVDDRPPLCPNGHGLLVTVSETEQSCETCSYFRKVLQEEYEENSPESDIEERLDRKRGDKDD